MGLHDRPYYGQEQGGGFGERPRLSMGLPRPGPAVKWLLIINIVVFVVQELLLRGWGVHWFAARAVVGWQVWRYLTCQFLHGSPFHLLFNMVGLYFLGMYLERSWGTKRFLRFYLICGAVGGVVHVLLTLVLGSADDQFSYLLGASGGVYAIVLACAILFPQIQLIVIVFPVRIRVIAAIYIGIGVFSMLLNIRRALEGGSLGGGTAHAAHLGGAVAAAVWIWLLPRMSRAATESRARARSGAWKRKMQRQADRDAEVDRILEKIRDRGLDSLTDREKRILQQATQRQREDDRDMYRS